jgi:hypothetical protein
MTQQDPIDQLLAELRQELSDTRTMINIVVALRRNSSHLLQLVHTMLADLAVKIDAALPSFPEEDDEQDIT